MRKKVLVVGGGAAGMMAAICAAQRGAEVTLFEPNERLGKKLNITGKGRCNVTNDSNTEQLLAHVIHNSRFLYSAFSRFDGRAAMAFFEELGVPLKVERGRRVFPKSDRSFDISGALERRLQRLGVMIVRERAEQLWIEEGKLRGVVTERMQYASDAVILATGGVSYPATGSTGDGYRLAQEAGHSIVPPRPSLVPLLCAEEDCREMQGLTLKNIRFRLRDERGKVCYDEMGEMLFTHFGLSGPLALSASVHMTGENDKHYVVSLDLKPALDDEMLQARLQRDFEERKNQTFHGLLGGLVPRSMVSVLAKRCGVSEELRVHTLTREQRRKLRDTLRNFTFTVTGTRPIEEAIVTAGGVCVREIVPATMESKKLPGLYFAGEIMDVDAYTGGFNLQIAWASGKAAGEAAGADI